MGGVARRLDVANFISEALAIAALITAVACIRANVESGACP